MLLFDVGILTHIVGILHLLRPFEGFFQWNLRFDSALLIGFQVLLHEFKAFFRVVIPIKENECIGWMIVGLVERLEVLIGEVRDMERVATIINTIDMLWEERIFNSCFKDAIR